MRVLVANQPRSYREVIARVLEQARPNVETLVSEPSAIVQTARALAPDLLLCSDVAHALASRVESWIELYPEGRDLAHVCVRGRQTTLEDPDLSELLAVVDAVAAAQGRRTAAAT
jgi:hypothetical protein